MRLREDTVYLRLTTREDLLDDGRMLEIVAELQEAFATRWATFTDLHHKMRPAPVGDDLAPVRALSSVGLHQRARFALAGTPESGIARVELNAVGHPYTGNFVTMLDVRFRGPWLREDAARIERLAEIFVSLVERTEPLCAHAHDTDDNTIQNTASATTLRLGFGVDVDDDVELADNPGRELSLGEFRFCANWLTYVGPEMLERLASVRRGEPDLAWEPLAGGRMVRLYADPFAADARSARDAQRACRDDLGYAELVAQQGWRFGYWQRKG